MWDLDSLWMRLLLHQVWIWTKHITFSDFLRTFLFLFFCKTIYEILLFKKMILKNCLTWKKSICKRILMWGLNSNLIGGIWILNEFEPCELFWPFFFIFSVYALLPEWFLLLIRKPYVFGLSGKNFQSLRGPLDLHLLFSNLITKKQC